MAQLVKNSPAKVGDARDMGLIPGSGRSPGEGNGSSILIWEIHEQRQDLVTKQQQNYLHLNAWL